MCSRLILHNNPFVHHLQLWEKAPVGVVLESVTVSRVAHSGVFGGGCGSEKACPPESLGHKNHFAEYMHCISRPWTSLDLSGGTGGGQS